MIPFWELKWYSTDESTSENITHYSTNIIRKRAMQSKSNALEVSIRLFGLHSTGTPFLDTSGNPRFEIDQDVYFYLSGTAPVVSGDLDMTATIADINEVIEENKHLLKLTCVDKTYAVLGGAVAGNFSGKVHEIIDDVIKFVARDRTWNEIPEVEFGATGTGPVENEKHDGTAFSDTTYSVVWKPAYTVLEELSQPEYTGDDRPFYFYVDKDNKLHWFYPYQTSDAILRFSNNNVLKVNLKKEEREEVNMVIFNAGSDKNGNSILWYKFNQDTTSGKLKTAYYDWSEIINEIRLPGYTWDSLSYSSATNDQVRTHAKEKGEAKCDEIFALKGLKWKGDITMKGTKNFQCGQLIELVAPKFGFHESNKLKIRIMEVIHNLSNSWITILRVEEDPLARE